MLNRTCLCGPVPSDWLEGRTGQISTIIDPPVPCLFRFPHCRAPPLLYTLNALSQYRPPRLIYKVPPVRIRMIGVTEHFNFDFIAYNPLY